jgi:CrcB protein
VTYLYVALGAAVGAPLRYLVHRFVEGRHRTGLPWGVLAVNVAGSLLAGLLVGWQPLAPGPSSALVVGFCGSFTTYSALAYDTVHLVREGQAVRGLAFVVATGAVGVAAAALGWLVGDAVA